MIDDVNTRRHPPPPVLHFQHSAAHLDEPINFVLLIIDNTGHRLSVWSSGPTSYLYKEML